MRASILAALFLCLLTSTVQARKVTVVDVAGYMGTSPAPTSFLSFSTQKRSKPHRKSLPRGQVVGHRPAGCPTRYCGCATALKLYGRIRPELNLASNWIKKFPRTTAAPWMAAARSGHVMLLLEHVGGDKWKVWDANSGGGLTRIHVRSIRGFAIVNPHATSVARL